MSPDPFPRCRTCGYDLRGLLGPASEGRCPECAEEFNPYAPFVPEPCRPAALILFDMCWPTWALVSAGAVVGAVEPQALTLALLMTFWTPAGAAWIAAVLWPPVRVWHAARSRHRERTPLSTAICCLILALAFNLAMLKVVGAWVWARAG